MLPFRWTGSGCLAGERCGCMIGRRREVGGFVYMGVNGNGKEDGNTTLSCLIHERPEDCRYR